MRGEDPESTLSMIVLRQYNIVQYLLSVSDLKTMLSRSKGYSMMPVVGTLDLSMSCSEGR